MKQYDFGIYNFDTGEYDTGVNYLESIDSALPYIPNVPTPAARSLFVLLVEYKGMSIQDAFLEVLERAAGIHKDTEE